MKKLILIFLIPFIGLTSQAQLQLSDVDLDRVPFKKIQEYIHNLQKKDIQYITDIQPTCDSAVALQEDYYHHKKTYHVKNNIDKVWKAYRYLKPEICWSGRRMNYGMLLDKGRDTVTYANEQYNGLNVGHIFCLNLKLLKGAYNMVVAFEVIRVNDQERIIEFSYLKGGKAKGRQRIQLFTMGNGTTKIIHSSDFKSNSKLRDRILYPHFHSLSIKAFHRNIRHTVMHNKKEMMQLSLR